MTVSVYTPGPWEVTEWGGPLRLGIHRMTPDINGEYFAVVETMGIDTQYRLEARANARLMAAAPLLLEACKQALNDPNIDLQRMDVLESAIAQAEQETT